jgi:hypothetical protein
MEDDTPEPVEGPEATVVDRRLEATNDPRVKRPACVNACLQESLSVTQISARLAAHLHPPLVPGSSQPCGSSSSSAGSTRASAAKRGRAKLRSSLSFHQPTPITYALWLPTLDSTRGRLVSVGLCMWRSSQRRRTRTFHGHERQRRHRAGCGGACARRRASASPASMSSRTGATPWPRGWPWRCGGAARCAVFHLEQDPAWFFSNICSARRPGRARAFVARRSRHDASDITLLTIDSHPNIEVRMFNLVAMRSLRAWHGRRLRRINADAQQILLLTVRSPSLLPQDRRRIFWGA